VLEVFDFEFGVQAALEEDFDAAFVDGVFDFGENIFVAVEVALFVAGGAVEGAELATNPADVGVIEDSPYDIGDDLWISSLLATKIGERSELERIVVVE
jgi:hypothetical protein